MNSVVNQALELTASERSGVIEKLLISLDMPDDSIDTIWEKEADARIEAYEKGEIEGATSLKDIGDGCGDEALRVVKLMQDQNVIWKPGIKDGERVSVQYTLPVKFKIKEYTPPPPYTIYQGDSIYLELETGVEFKGGDDALNIFFILLFFYRLFYLKTTILHLLVFIINHFVNSKLGF